MNTEEAATYAVKAPRKRGPKPGSKRKPRAVVTPSPTTPPVAVVYRGEGIEVIGVYLDARDALRALAETEGAKVALVG
jgi:hypothetical protein